ncbi:hypothetical protein HY837_01285 [archaeon]|nr:hypothetical protein [archaeon]
MRKIIGTILAGLLFQGCVAPNYTTHSLSKRSDKNYFTKLMSYAKNLDNVLDSLENNYNITSEDYQRKLDLVNEEYGLFELNFQANRSQLSQEDFRLFGRLREEFKARLVTDKVRYIEANNLPDERWGE